MGRGDAGRVRRKAFDVCRVFGCRRPTWSGRAERDEALRYCRFCAPWQHKIATHGKVVVNPRPLRFVGALACVFRPYELVASKTGGEAEVLAAGTLCLAPAPRRLRGERSSPRHPNLYGDPLCERHRGYASDARAFERSVDGPPTSVVRSEEAERRDGLRGAIEARFEELARGR